jgi:hypothetical protein
MTDFGSWEELYGFLRGVDYPRYCEYLANIDAFIRTDKQFSNKHEINQLYRLIEENK